MKYSDRKQFVLVVKSCIITHFFTIETIIPYFCVHFNKNGGGKFTQTRDFVVFNKIYSSIPEHVQHVFWSREHRAKNLQKRSGYIEKAISKKEENLAFLRSYRQNRILPPGADKSQKSVELVTIWRR